MKSLFLLCILYSILSLTQISDARNVREDYVEPDAGAGHRSKRADIWSGIVGAVGCSPQVVKAARECGEDLDNRMRGYDPKDADEAAKCCVFADFRRCVYSQSKQECGDDASHVVDQVVSGAQRALNEKCGNYDYYSPTCVFILWYSYIIVGSIVLAILTVGCCLGACCCR